jgi:hypothetical protein
MAFMLILLCAPNIDHPTVMLRALMSSGCARALTCDFKDLEDRWTPGIRAERPA